LPRGLFQALQSAVFTDDEGISLALYNSGKGSIPLQISHKVGYNEKKQFYILFKKHMGTTPNKYRMKTRKP